MATSIRVGVALFSKSATTPDPYFSWAIATTEGAWAESEVVMYDIAYGGKSRRWEPRARRVYLSEEEAFCGVLEFAKTDIPGEDLDEFIRDHPADDDGWRVRGPAGWSTAMWTLKIMCSLEDAAIWEIPTEYGVDGLFDIIIGKAFVMLETVDDFPVLSLARDRSSNGTVIGLQPEVLGSSATPSPS
ncbi:hypothetical protein BDZ89DRAFT_1131715 [Hymenopellis radicata]|nr:hypothetical protein BDZ89DRAFT_1131715 [Hymenopellis radicata]